MKKIKNNSFDKTQDKWEEGLENIQVYSNGEMSPLKEDLYPGRLEAIKSFIKQEIAKEKMELYREVIETIEICNQDALNEGEKTHVEAIIEALKSEIQEKEEVFIRPTPKEVKGIVNFANSLRNSQKSHPKKERREEKENK